MEFFKSHKVYDFMRVRKYWIFLSIALATLSFISLYVPGPNYGTDFRGGTEIEVAFKKHVGTEQIRHAVTATNQFSEPDILHVESKDSNDQYLIRVQEISTVDDSTKEQLRKALCLGVEGDADPKCPKNAQATEVKF